ncbi:hypothetical protein ACFVTC_20375 [Streptomyces sp. NPDC057950]|uniref:hypothetical protein n=1 Tax=Streptomyces sp. NPDC057950 TaxID=3346288 RepID=UPI0036E4A5EA
MHELSVASGGDVLYLRELVLGALTAGDLTEDGEIWHLREGRLPGTARPAEVVGTRLDTAARAGRPVLERLALCEPLPLADAESLAPPRTLTALERAGLIRVVQDRRRVTVTLAHPLYGEVPRAGLPVLRRRTLLPDQAARVEARGARRRGDPLRVATWRPGRHRHRRPGPPRPGRRAGPPRPRLSPGNREPARTFRRGCRLCLRCPRARPCVTRAVRRRARPRAAEWVSA